MKTWRWGSQCDIIGDAWKVTKGAMVIPQENELEHTICLLVEGYNCYCWC